MQAIHLTEFGGPDKIKITKVEKPKPKINEVLVRVKAVGVNPIDSLISTGTFPFKKLPFILGFDGSGVVAEVGSQVKKWKVGDRVWFYKSETGAFAEYTVCNQNSLGRLPDKITFEQGAALGIPYCTAYLTLFNRAFVKAGQTVLVHGASGATGMAFVQLAYGIGCTVLGTAGTVDGLAELKKMHAHGVFNHKEEGYREKIKEFSGDGVDVIIEMVADKNLGKDMKLLNVKGKVVILGGLGPTEINAMDVLLAEGNIMAVRLFTAALEEERQAYAGIERGLQIGFLLPVVDRKVPFKEAPSVFKDIASDTGRKGRVVMLL